MYRVIGFRVRFMVFNNISVISWWSVLYWWRKLEILLKSRYNWNIVQNDIKHHNPNLNIYIYIVKTNLRYPLCNFVAWYIVYFRSFIYRHSTIINSSHSIGHVLIRPQTILLSLIGWRFLQKVCLNVLWKVHTNSQTCFSDHLY